MSVLPFKEDEDFRKHNQHAEESAASQLRDLVSEILAPYQSISSIF